MKKLLPILIGVLGFAGSVFALPTIRYEQHVYPFLQNAYELGTSTSAWSGGTFVKLCLTGDSCITTWPVGGAGGGIVWPWTKQVDNSQGTTTLMSFLGGFYSSASSTVSTLCILTDCRSAWPTAGTFAWPFTLQANGFHATSTGILLSGGLVSASTTIGSNAVANGLTINGGATSTLEFLHLGSTTLQNFTGINATTTSATSTNLAITGLSNVFPYIFPDGDIRAATISTGLTNTNGVLTATLGTTIAPNELIGQPIGNSRILGINFDSSRFEATGTTALTAGSFNASTTVVNNLPIILSTNATSTFAYWTNALASASTTLQQFTGIEGTTTNFAVTALSKDSLVASNKTGGIVSTSTIGANQTDSSIAKSAITITVAGTANQITSSAAAQDLTANRTWTLSLPTTVRMAQASTTVLDSGFLSIGKTATTTINGTGDLYVNGSSTLQVFTGINYLALGSTTLQRFSASAGTTTNATSTTLAFYNNDTSPMWSIRNFGSYLSLATTTVVNSVNSGATSTVDAVQFAATGTPSISVGTTTPTASAMFTYSGTTYGNAFVVAGATNTPLVVTTNGLMYAPGTTVQSGAATDYWCYDAAAQFIRVSNTCTVSALKFKKDINALTLGLDTVLQMKPVTYYLKDPLSKDASGEQIGFIADWSVKLLPDLITHDSQGEIHGFNYEQYTSVLTKAIQDFYGQFQKLVARVSGLEKKVNAQQKQIDDLNARLLKLEK